MLSLEEALQRITDDLVPVGAESVNLLEARDRVLTENVTAERRLPAADNSAMDGYAVVAADTEGACAEEPVPVRLIGTIRAGGLPEGRVDPGTAIRIFTGAPLPQGADAVVMQEETRREGDVAYILEPARAGQNVRYEGDDVAVGDPILEAGAVVRPGDIGMLAAQGRSWVRVHRRPRVAIVPTGDEVVEIDRPVGPGKVADSNSILLACQVAEAGGIPLRCPIAPDEPQALTSLLENAAEANDLILTSGGASVGDFDHVRDVLDQAGSIDFWRVAVKPGKPLAYGRLRGVPLIGLPGNPVSSFVTFELFARPAIRRLAGHASLFRPRRAARLATPLARHHRRREFFRGRLRLESGSDEVWVHPLAQQGSGHLSSMVGVDALVDIASGEGEVPAGELVEVFVLNEQSLAPKDMPLPH